MLGKERFKGLHVFGSLTEIIARRSQAYSFLSGDQKKNEESLCSTPFSSFGRHHYSLSRTELLSHPPPCHLFVKNIDVAKRTEWGIRASPELPRASSAVPSSLSSTTSLQEGTSDSQVFIIWLSPVDQSLCLSLLGPCRASGTRSLAWCSPAGAAGRRQLTLVVLLHLLLIFPSGCKADTTETNNSSVLEKQQKPQRSSAQPLGWE